jgi:transposase
LKNIHRKTACRYSTEDKVRIFLAGLSGEESTAALCRRDSIAKSIHYKWSKEFLEAGKRQLSGDTARPAAVPEMN